MNEDFTVQNLEQWRAVLSDLFSGDIPLRKVWRNRGEIIDVLNKIGVENLNHVFFAGGGGLDLTAARISHENECIELDFDGLIEIAKVKSLSFNSFENDDMTWAYFRIDTEPLKQSGVYEVDEKEYTEQLFELFPGEYVDYGIADRPFWKYDSDGNALPFPEESRRISRCLKGSYVIFAKASIYNRIPETYNAIHRFHNEESFRAMIQKAVSEAK